MEFGGHEMCISKPTFKRHLTCKNKFAIEEKKKIGRSETIPKQIEDDLKQHILQLDNMLFGLTITDIRRLAFEIVEKNNMPNSFNKTTRF